MPKTFEQKTDVQKTEEPKEQEQQAQEPQTQEASGEQSEQDSQGKGLEADENARAKEEREQRRIASEIKEHIQNDNETLAALQEYTSSYSDGLMQYQDIALIKEKRMEVLTKKQVAENIKYRLMEQLPKQVQSIESTEYREQIENMLDSSKSQADLCLGSMDQCLKLNSEWVVTIQYLNLGKKVEKLDEDRKKNSLVDPGDESKGMKGSLSAGAYKKFNGARLFYQAELDALPAPEQERGIESRRRTEQLLGQLGTALDTYKNSMPEGEKKALEIMDKEGQDAKESLNSTYRDGMPFIRLIRKAASLEHTQDVEKEEETDWTENYEKAMEVVEFIGDATKSEEEKEEEENEKPKDLKEWLTEHAKTALGWILGQIGVSEAVHSATSAVGKFNELFGPLISLGKLITSYKEFFDKKKDMGEDEKVIEAKALGKDTLEGVMSGVEKIGEVAGGIPYIGAVFNIIKNMVAMGYSIHQAIVSGRRKNEMDRSKEALKQRMFQKRAKYQTDSSGLRDQNLFGFMGYQKEKSGIFDFQKSARAYHVNKDSSGKNSDDDLIEGTTTFEKQKQELESKVGGEGLHDDIMSMKDRKNRGELSEEERVEYYQMKTLATMRQYEETKAAKETNKDRVRQSVGSIVESSVSLLANISGLIPGLGQAISHGTKIILKIGKSGAGLVGKIKDRVAEKMDLPSSKSNQKKHRSAMGKNMYEQMVSVSRFLNPEGTKERDSEGGAEKPALFHVMPAAAKRVSKQVNYLDGLFRGLSARYTKIMAADSENSMIGKLGEAFTREGTQ